MPRFAANLSKLLTGVPRLVRFLGAAGAGFPAAAEGGVSNRTPPTRMESTESV